MYMTGLKKVLSVTVFMVSDMYMDPKRLSNPSKVLE